MSSKQLEELLGKFHKPEMERVPLCLTKDHPDLAEICETHNKMLEGYNTRVEALEEEHRSAHKSYWDKAGALLIEKGIIIKEDLEGGKQIAFDKKMGMFFHNVAVEKKDEKTLVLKTEGAPEIKELREKIDALSGKSADKEIKLREEAAKKVQEGIQKIHDDNEIESVEIWKDVDALLVSKNIDVKDRNFQLLEDGIYEIPGCDGCSDCDKKDTCDQASE